MILPEKFKLLGLDWAIKRDKAIAHEGQCYGSTHHSTQTIYLDPENTTLHNEQVFFHELLHAVFWQMGLCKSTAFNGCIRYLRGFTTLLKTTICLNELA